MATPSTVSALYERCRHHVHQATLLSSIDSALNWDERTMLPPAAGTCGCGDAFA